MSRSRSFRGSLQLIDDYNSYVMYCYVCRKAGPDIAGKMFKRESLVYQNKS